MLAAPTRKLLDGNSMPSVACGVFRLSPGKETYDSVLSALKLGYRHVDTAALYGNEESVGKAIRDSGVPREEIFVTTKLNTFMQVFDYAGTLKAIQQQNALLNVGCIDCYLIHAPRANRLDQWRALMEAQKAGLVKTIGVSDYSIKELLEIEDANLPIPTVLQIELNPFLADVRKAEVEYAQKKGIVCVCWGAMAKNGKDDDKAVTAVAARYGRSVPDVLLKWSQEMGFVTLTTSCNPKHQQSNLEIVADPSWTLSSEDMEALKVCAATPFHSIRGGDLSGAKGH